MPFANRTDAGRRLAAMLTGYRGKDTVVLALPRGGVEVAFPVAQSLGAPLDLLLVRKIGVPQQPELAMGAIIDGTSPTIVRNEDVIRLARVSEAKFESVSQRELTEIERRRAIYLRGRLPVPVEGRIAIVIDDGIATGATVRAALHGLRNRNPREIVLAVPVAPAEVLEELQDEADEVICLEPLSNMGAISVHYRHFPQLDDNDVIALLDAPAPPA